MLYNMGYVHIPQFQRRDSIKAVHGRRKICTIPLLSEESLDLYYLDTIYSIVVIVYTPPMDQLLKIKSRTAANSWSARPQMLAS